MTACTLYHHKHCALFSARTQQWVHLPQWWVTTDKTCKVHCKSRLLFVCGGQWQCGLLQNYFGHLFTMLERENCSSIVVSNYVLSVMRWWETLEYMYRNPVPNGKVKCFSDPRQRYLHFYHYLSIIHCIYTLCSGKIVYLIFSHNFWKYRPIFKILSLSILKERF